MLKKLHDMISVGRNNFSIEEKKQDKDRYKLMNFNHNETINKDALEYSNIANYSYNNYKDDGNSYDNNLINFDKKNIENYNKKTPVISSRTYNNVRDNVKLIDFNSDPFKNS